MLILQKRPQPKEVSVDKSRFLDITWCPRREIDQASMNSSEFQTVLLDIHFMLIFVAVSRQSQDKEEKPAEPRLS